MVGKPTIPKSVHNRVRRLHSQGMGRKAIAAELEVSTYTVRKALDDGFAEREAARHRATGAERYRQRKDDPDYVAYQSEYNATDKRRVSARETMARIRAKRRRGS